MIAEQPVQEEQLVFPFDGSYPVRHDNQTTNSTDNEVTADASERGFDPNQSDLFLN